jgi:hypothetical protein
VAVALRFAVAEHVLEVGKACVAELEALMSSDVARSVMVLVTVSPYRSSARA